MSTNSQNNSENQEIDLSLISKKIGDFFQGINKFIFNCIQFALKNIIVISLLFIIGVGLGLFLDTTNKTYDHQIIVQPNFGSTDYLYSKIDLLNSKIKENDTVFLQKIGILDPSKLSKIEIKPIVDVYKFIAADEKNFDLLKLMAEDSDIKKIVEENATSKNYPYHLISFSTKSFSTNKKTVEPILNYLNNSLYYSQIQKEYINNVKLKMKANDVVIAQIDGFLNSFSNKVNGNSPSDKLVYYNENTQLNDVIKTKDNLVKEQGNHRIELVALDKIVKENSSTINIENKKAVNGKMKLILPLLFILLFVAIKFFISFYKKQTLLNKQ